MELVALPGVGPSVGEDGELLKVDSVQFRQLLSGASELADKPAPCWTCDNNSSVIIIVGAVFMNVHASRGGELSCVITVAAFRNGGLSLAATMVS